MWQRIRHTDAEPEHLILFFMMQKQKFGKQPFIEPVQSNILQYPKRKNEINLGKSELFNTYVNYILFWFKRCYV